MMKKTAFTRLMTMALSMLPMMVMAQQDRTSTLLQSEENGWEYEVKAGVNIGGASPIPLPEEIREITSYSPKLNGVLEATVTKWLGRGKVWGISTGLRFEEKGMITGARVKNYSMEILNGGSKVSGRWTGHVKTDYNSTFLTLPVMGNYRFSDTWKVRAGMFLACRMDGEFSGVVSDGYLREGNPIGEKAEFTDGKTATYDFSSDLCRLQYGAQMGATWRAFRHFTVNADLTWAFNDIFKSSFQTVSFNMYSIYLNLGFGYRF